MLILGMVLSIPACLLAAFAPTDDVLFGARVLGGVSAGMAYPTTLALIAALWSGPARTKSIALWSALGGGIAALGPLVAGALLEHFDWGSVFLITLPLAVVALLDGAGPSFRPRERDDRPGRQPRRHPLGRPGRRADPVDQLRAGPQQGNAGARPGRDRARCADRRSTSGSAARGTRCTTSTSPRGRRSGSRPAPGSSCSAR